MPVWEIPITSITNGVHLRSWLNNDLATLYDQYLQPDWRERLTTIRRPGSWCDDIPDQELWEVHRRRKRRLITFVRERPVASARGAGKASASGGAARVSEVLDPEALTIGFARRFATYKRATLLFRDVDRLKRILCNPERPVQIVIAGKAHPKDHPGKTLIREIVQLSRDPGAGQAAGVRGGLRDAAWPANWCRSVDVWLNNPAPRRGSLRHQRHEGRRSTAC